MVDGATDLEKDAFLPADSDVQWLVDRVGERLAEVGALPVRESATDLLRSLSYHIGQEMRSLAFPFDRIYPTCSIGLLLADSSRLQLARVGDPTCLAFGQEPVELSTEFFGRREAQAVGRSNSGGLEDDAARGGIVERRQQYIHGDLEESVFSGHPKARLRIQSSVLEAARFEHVLLCTDGFARAVVDYGLYPDWERLLRHALEEGLSPVLDGIRSHEQAQPPAGARNKSTHFKKSDDATALLIKI